MSVGAASCDPGSGSEVTGTLAVKIATQCVRSLSGRGLVGNRIGLRSPGPTDLDEVRGAVAVESLGPVRSNPNQVLVANTSQQGPARAIGPKRGDRRIGDGDELFGG